MNLKDFSPSKKPALTSKDKKILKDLEKTEKKITEYLEQFHFSLAGENLYHYFWHTFADKIIEQMKTRIRENKNKASAQYVLYQILSRSLVLLHPFMPFVTEAIWQKLPKEKGKNNLLIIEKWPN